MVGETPWLDLGACLLTVAGSTRVSAASAHDFLTPPCPEDPVRLDFRSHESLALLARYVDQTFSCNDGSGLFEPAQRFACTRILNVRKVDEEGWFHTFSCMLARVMAQHIALV